MVVLSTDLPAVHMIRPWSDEEQTRRSALAAAGQEAADLLRERRDEASHPMNLCERRRDELVFTRERRA